MKVNLGELAADGALGVALDSRLGRVLFVLVRPQAAGAAELLEGLAGVHLCHDGALHVGDVSETTKESTLITGNRVTLTPRAATSNSLLAHGAALLWGGLV